MRQSRRLPAAAVILILLSLVICGCNTGDGSYAVTFWGTLGSEAGQMESPGGFCLSAEGNILIADTNNHRIEEFTRWGAFVAAWGEEGSGPGQFSYPMAVAADSKGNIYVADTLNNRIQKFDAQYNFLLQWGVEGNAPGQLLVPFDLDLDRQDNVYVADSGNSRIQMFTSQGILQAFWGEEGTEPGQLQHPGGITVSPDGRIYVADSDNHRIQVFSREGAFLGYWGRQGNSIGELFNPYRLAVDDRGNVYVVDSGNGRLQKFTSAGTCLGEWAPDAGFIDLVDVIPGFSSLLLLDQEDPLVYDIDPALVQPGAAARTVEDQPADIEKAVRALELQDHSTWMADAAVTIQDKPFQTLVIPGTHDSGTYAISPSSAWAHDGNPNHAKEVIDKLNEELGVFSHALRPYERYIYDKCVEFQAGWSKTQYLGMDSQLKGGIRYFDFRVSIEEAADDNREYYPGGFYLVHSMRGAKLQDALNSVRDFCREHPREIVLIDVNHMYFRDHNGAMPESVLLDFDAMVSDTLVYEDGTSMLVDPAVQMNVSVGQIWELGKQVLMFVSDTRLCKAFPQKYWHSGDIRTVWEETDSLSKLRSFLEKEITHCDFGFHVCQAIRTETETDIINGALTWFYKDALHGHTTTQRIVKHFVDKYGYSVDAPQDILEFASRTLASISTYLGWIGFEYSGPKIQIINNFGDDQVYSWWLYKNGYLKADGYVDCAIKLNVKYFGDGGPQVWLAHKVTLNDITHAPPGFAPIWQPTITNYEGFLVYATTDSPRRIAVRAMHYNYYPQPTHVLNETTETFPTAARIRDKVMIAWPAAGTRIPTFTSTQDSYTYTATVTDATQKVSSESIAMTEYNGDMVTAFRQELGDYEGWNLDLRRYINGDPSKPQPFTYHLTFETRSGPCLATLDDVFWITAVRDSKAFYLVEQYDAGNNRWGFRAGHSFDADWTDDGVSIAYIHGYVVVAWRGGNDIINLYIRGTSGTWYKRELPEKTASTPCISFVGATSMSPDRLFLVWRGTDNRINSAVIEGL